MSQPQDLEAAGSQTPALRLAAVPGASPDKWVRRWHQRFPHLQLRVDYYDDDPADAPPDSGTPGAAALARVDAGVADIAYLRLPADADIDGEDHHRVWLYEELPVVCAAAGHFIAAADESVPWEELAEEPRLRVADMLPAAEEASLPGVLEPKQGGQLARAERIAMEVVASGAGVLVLPNSVARALARKDVVIRTVEGIPGWRVGLLWRRDRDDELIQEFIGIARGRRSASGRSQLKPNTAERASNRVKPARKGAGAASSRPRRPAPRKSPQSRKSSRRR